MSKIKLPSVLAFERKLETSDALMYSGSWGDISNNEHWKKIPISKRQNRATQSSIQASPYDTTQPNPASSNSEDANLEEGQDTLKVSFSTRIIGNLGKPFSSNSPIFDDRFVPLVEDFKKRTGMSMLAFRYAYNIVNGRFLWRNRVGAEELKIAVSIADEKTPLMFQPRDFSLQNFDKNKADKNLQILSQALQRGLSGDANSHALIEVTAYVKLGDKQHVFPSQEMNMNEGDKDKGKKLFKIGDCAALHNVKIGNALRTVDTWHGKKILIPGVKKKSVDVLEVAQEEFLPVAADPYGSVTQRARAYRAKKFGNDLYTLMEKWVNLKEGEKLAIEDQCFVVANLIRGGVFGGE